MILGKVRGMEMGQLDVLSRNREKAPQLGHTSIPQACREKDVHASVPSEDEASKGARVRGCKNGQLFIPPWAHTLWHMTLQLLSSRGAAYSPTS